jgi:hypothetical protein
MNKKDFLKMVKSDLATHGFICRMTYKKKSRKKRALGCFDKRRKEIVVARNHKKWFEILIHEYCHFIQHKEQICNLYDTRKNKLKCELDCDKRVLRMIDKYNLPVNKKEYIRCRWFILLFMSYGIIKKCPILAKIKKERELKKSCRSLIPTNDFLPKSKYLKMPRRLVRLFNKHIIWKKNK